MGDFDPATVPVNAAATLMLITDRPKLEVLMLKRNTKTVFAGGMWVFPGGRVDPVDNIVDAALITGGAPSGMPDDAVTGTAAGVAAIRETFEEAGVLLAYGEDVHRIISVDGKSVDGKTDFGHRLDTARAALNAHQPAAFTEFLTQEQLSVALDRVHFLARWITPPGSSRRFDTRFFIASMPANQRPLQDNSEITHCSWFTPQQALEGYADGKMNMMTPTLGTLSALAEFTSEQEVFSALAQSNELERIHINIQTRELLMPNNEGYNTANETIEFGWMKLALSTKVSPPKATGNVRNRLNQG